MTKIKLKNEQIIQMKNISDTLIEATDHFTTYIKDREFTQSIYLFSSIVEGYESINRMFKLYDVDSKDDVINLLRKIEKNLVLIANELERENLFKIAEIVQFTLMPSFRTLNKVFKDKSVNKATYTIGIYHDKVNPRKVYPEERINALIQESEKQNINLIFFTSKDLNLDTKKIDADLFINGEWQTLCVNFPNVVNNIGVTSKHQQSITERKLRRIIPFTSFGVGNKLFLPKVMVKHRRYAELLVPFRMVSNEQVIYDYLESERIAVLKPILGARGESIYFVQKKGNRFIVSEHRQERIYNHEKFSQWIQFTLLKVKFSYIIQRYVDCKTKNGEPFDIRAHMQKDNKGKWTITKMYPRIGSKQSILSNISRGGRTDELTAFLMEEYGENTGKKHYKKLQQLSLELTKYLDRIHNFSLDELGLDLAIDHTGRFWLHEANNGPQSAYHEAERAVNTIGYAKYIAENGIVKRTHIQNKEGQFNAKNSSLPFAETDHPYQIGMLKHSDDDQKLAIACAFVARYENISFYTFTTKDIDYDEMLLRGHFYENGEWVTKIVEYPNVIYDRFRLKGVKEFNDVYEELEGIPFTNEFYGNSIDKLEVYDNLESTGNLDDVLIPYKEVNKTSDIFDHLKLYSSIIVKPSVGSFARGVHFIEKRNNKRFFVAEGDNEMEYTEISLRKYLNEVFKEGTWIVQKYIHTRTIDGNPFDIRVHIMKDGKNDWGFVALYPRIGLRYATIMAMNIGGYTGKIDGFLNRNFQHLNSKDIINEIKSVALNITENFSRFYDLNFNEIAFDFALNSDGEVYLIELNVNKPGITSFEFDLAQFAIPNALYVARENEKENSK